VKTNRPERPKYPSDGTAWEALAWWRNFGGDVLADHPMPRSIFQQRMYVDTHEKVYVGFGLHPLGIDIRCADPLVWHEFLADKSPAIWEGKEEVELSLKEVAARLNYQDLSAYLDDQPWVKAYAWEEIEESPYKIIPFGMKGHDPIHDMPDTFPNPYWDFWQANQAWKEDNNG
tara:strand:+ start:3825 stop:4343 length:519 start_codon:yes stop_codon:yes gene_type:complete